MIGAYRDGRHFAYPGWRLTVPGGPAGGHYKGFTHTQAAGTDIPPGDNYEQDREDGMSAHDSVHASQRNPRGVYRSAAEVPPRPNASGSAHTYRSFQRQHHPGQAVAPGSFPADFVETNEDDFLPARPNTVAAPVTALHGLGAASQIIRAGVFSSGTGDGFICPPNADCSSGIPVIRPPFSPLPLTCPYGMISAGGQCVTPYTAPPPGATSVVPQPAPTPLPLPPSPSIPVYTVPPVSPTPGPIVATNEVVPLNDGSGNYINVSTGQVIPASQVTQNPATGQLIAGPAAAGFSMAGALTWLEQPSSFFPSIPNWGLVAGAVAAAALLMGRKHK
jgi:hypothetical protein